MPSMPLILVKESYWSEAHVIWTAKKLAVGMGSSCLMVPQGDDQGVDWELGDVCRVNLWSGAEGEENRGGRIFTCMSWNSKWSKIIQDYNFWNIFETTFLAIIELISFIQFKYWFSVSLERWRKVSGSCLYLYMYKYIDGLGGRVAHKKAEGKKGFIETIYIHLLYNYLARPMCGNSIFIYTYIYIIYI